MTFPSSFSSRVGWTDATTPMDVESLRQDFEKLFYDQAKFPAVATVNDHFQAIARVVRDRLLARWIRSVRTYLERQSRTVAYLSAAYLLGPQLGNNLLGRGLTEAVREALARLSISLDQMLEHEEEPGLGNGGLGRLAACYLDSNARSSIRLPPMASCASMAR